MAKHTKTPTGVRQLPMPAYGQPMLRLQRDAPGVRWARLALRVVVIGGLVAMTIELVARLVH